MNETCASILIIEPDRPTLELYEKTLNQEFEVFCAADEKQALVFLKQKEIHAVVLEPSGLGENGWYLLSSIKNSAPGYNIPVIICTILDEQLRGLEMGASVYLTKPVLPTVLQQTLHRVVFASRG